MTAAIRDAYDAWKDAAAARSARGELRVSREERERLEHFVTLLDAATPADRAQWDALRESLEIGDAACACGHPLTHHDAAGSCFHVVGCATGCACGSA